MMSLPPAPKAGFAIWFAGMAVPGLAGAVGTVGRFALWRMLYVVSLFAQVSNVCELLSSVCPASSHLVRW